ncbi:hypothetical protein MRX96_034729 [Rhipicephalus microplus]
MHCFSSMHLWKSTKEKRNGKKLRQTEKGRSHHSGRLDSARTRYCCFAEREPADGGKTTDHKARGKKVWRKKEASLRSGTSGGQNTKIDRTSMEKREGTNKKKQWNKATETQDSGARGSERKENDRTVIFHSTKMVADRCHLSRADAVTASAGIGLLT